jgi:hypothetical protein
MTLSAWKVIVVGSIISRHLLLGLGQPGPVLFCVSASLLPYAAGHGMYSRRTEHEDRPGRVPGSALGTR